MGCGFPQKKGNPVNAKGEDPDPGKGKKNGQPKRRHHPAILHGRQKSCQTKESRRIVNTQNGLLGKIYVNLQKGMGIEKESFAELSRLESRLAKVLCINHPAFSAKLDRV